MILYQDCSSHFDLSKNMATMGWGLFSLYIYIENFKSLLVRNNWTVFSHNFAEVYLFVILYQDCLSHLDSSKKHGCQGAGLIFTMFLYRKCKNLLVRNHWTHFHIILQKCSFGDPLPRLYQDCSSHLDSSKHIAARGQGLFSLYTYLFRKL